MLLISFGSSCKKKDKTISENAADGGFDRKAMLTNYGSKVIVPAYTAFNLACVRLDSTITDFNLSPDAARLLNLQTVFKNTYRVWQSASSFGFGPADDLYLSKNMNTFPCDTNKINSYVNSGTYNLDAIANSDAKGLPAMDYLLFGMSKENTSLLVRYTTDNAAAKRKAYLAALSASMKTNASAVLNGWNNYMTTFLNASGTDVGSSLGQLINELDEDLEILKNYKIGLPLGKQSMGSPFPGKVEAYYCGISSELAVLHLKSVQSIYVGKGLAEGNLLGLDDNLGAIDAKYNNGSLNVAIANQFTAAINKMQAVPDPLSNSIINNQALVNAAYVEIQKLVVLLKTDMPSSLGILITYEDNDGD